MTQYMIIMDKNPGNIPKIKFIFMKMPLALNLNLDKAYEVSNTNNVEMIQLRTATINVFKNQVENNPSIE